LRFTTVRKSGCDSAFPRISIRRLCQALCSIKPALFNSLLEARHLKALMVLLSWARSSEKYDDWFLVWADELLTINIGEEDGMELLFPLLQAWVRTCVPDEAPVFTQFAAITAITDPPHGYDIRFCKEMVPVVQAFHAYIYRDPNRDPLIPVLKFT
jgi:hypothetical protein